MTESLCCIIDGLAVQRGRSTVSRCVGRRWEGGMDFHEKAVGGTTSSQGSVSRDRAGLRNAGCVKTKRAVKCDCVILVSSPAAARLRGPDASLAPRRNGLGC